MQLTPRYGDDAVIRMESIIDDPATPLLRQRSRLAGVLATLDDEQWAAPSRCEGWSVQDVIAHLVTTNQFFAFSIASGLQGAPTTFLAAFDPVASPAQLVEAERGRTPAEILDRFTKSNDELFAVVAAIDEQSWSTLAEAPPGHLALRLVALHALWDSWIHERDVVLPLGLPPVTEADEVGASLAYVVALGPAFLAASGSTRRGALELRVTDPDLRVVIEIGEHVLVHGGPPPAGAVTVAGDAVELLEALSFRVPLTAAIAENDRWLLGNLAEVFDRVG